MAALSQRYMATAKTTPAKTNMRSSSSKAKPKLGAPRSKPTAAAEPEVAASFAPIVSAFAQRPDVTLARMFSSRGVLKVKGKLFAMQVGDELVVKLPKQRVEALVRSGQARQFDPGHGRLMKEWATVAADAAPWRALAEEAYEYVAAVSSKPKPTRKPSAARSPRAKSTT